MSKIFKGYFLISTKNLSKGFSKTENSFRNYSKATSKEETKLFNLSPIKNFISKSNNNKRKKSPNNLNEKINEKENEEIEKEKDTKELKIALNA